MFNSTGERVGSIESIRDVTNIKAAELALRESEEKYRSMVDLLPDAVFIHDGTDVLFANPATYTMIGVKSKDEITGKNIFDFIHPDFKTKARKRIKEIFLSGKAVAFQEFRFLTIDKKVIDVESIGIPVTFMGKPAIQSIARDITARKNAEKTLRMKDELLHLTGEMAKVGGWEFDVITKEGSWTKEVARIHDLDPDAPTNVDIGVSFYEGDNLQKIQAAIEAAIKYGTPYDLELEMTSAKGIKKWVRTLGTPVMEGKTVRKINGIYQDITSRKEVEIVLENERKRLRTLIETIPDLVWLKDPQGKYLLCNPTYEYFVGAKEDEIKGKTDFDFENVDLAENFKKQDNLVLESDSPSVFQEWITCHANGEQRLVDTIKTPMYNSEGKLIGVLGVARDITEVFQSHESLRKSEANMRSLVENTDASIWSIDTEYRLIDANAHFYKHYIETTEYTLQTGDDVLNILPPEQIETWRRYYTRALKGESFSIEITGVSALEPKVVQYSFNPIITSDGKMIGITIFGHNITAIKKAQEEIYLLNTELEQRVKQRTVQLEHANKELEAFSYSVSHDLRAPLRGIDGWSLALLEDNADQLNDQGRIYLDRVRSEAQRMGHLIDDLLKLSRVSRFEMKLEEVNLSSLAQTIIDRLTEANAKRQFEFRVQPDIKVMSDRAMLEIALTNLLDNACKFTSKKPFAQIEFGKHDDDNQTVFYVRDNGAGFDMENAKNLFGAFQRMHKQVEFQGTGVGLATVQRIIHRHGGKIWAESQPDKGTIFFFTINLT